MKTTMAMIPMVIVIPERYEIDLRLNGDESMLTVIEHYGEDAPPELLNKTVELAKFLAPNAEIDIDSVKRTLTLTVIGSETSVISALQGETKILSEAYTVPIPRS